ncbi:hypothetical protein HDU76_009968 [Blyttiomyces sp. JEL0837]|nr:hypothetical protein HDU76_009968 [Blyttiomyces sp. JEL0837]
MAPKSLYQETKSDFHVQNARALAQYAMDWLCLILKVPYKVRPTVENLSAVIIIGKVLSTACDETRACPRYTYNYFWSSVSSVDREQIITHGKRLVSKNFDAPVIESARPQSRVLQPFDNPYWIHDAISPRDYHQRLFPVWTQRDGKIWLLSEPSGQYIVVGRNGSLLRGLRTLEDLIAAQAAEREQNGGFWRTVYEGIKRRLIGGD